MCVVQIEQYAVDFIQHEMDPPFALSTTDAEQVPHILTFFSLVVVCGIKPIYSSMRN